MNCRFVPRVIVAPVIETIKICCNIHQFVNLCQSRSPTNAAVAAGYSDISPRYSAVTIAQSRSVAFEVGHNNNNRLEVTAGLDNLLDLARPRVSASGLLYHVRCRCTECRMGGAPAIPIIPLGGYRRCPSTPPTIILRVQESLQLRRMIFAESFIRVQLS